MRDEDKTKPELINELAEMRQRITDLEKKPPEFRQVGKRPDSWLKKTGTNETPDDDITETIDFTSFLTQSVTASGSFDIRGDIWKTTFGKLLQALPMPALMIDTSHCIVSLNQAWAQISPDYQSLQGHPFSELFVSPSSAEKARELVKSIFSTRKSRVAQAALRINNATIWSQMAFRPIRIMNERFILVLADDLTREQREIEKRKQVEQVFREREAYLRAILNNAPFLMWLKDPEGRFLAVNDVFAQSCGQETPEAVIGKTDLDVWPLDLAQGYRADDREVMSQKRQKHVEEPVFDRGVTKWFETFKTPILDELANVIGTTGFARDITDRKVAEEKLQWNETLLRQMAASSPLAYLVVDNRTDEIFYFNHRFCEIWGVEQLEERMKKGELKNNDLIPYCIPLVKDAEQFAASCKPLQSEEDRSVVEDEIQFVHDRTIRRFSTQLRDEADRYYGRFYIFEEISDKKRVEKAMRDSEERYRSVFDNAAVGINVKAPDGTFAEINQALAHMLGYTPGELRKLSYLDITHPDDLQISGEMHAALERGDLDSYRIDKRYISKDGRVVWVDTSVRAVRDALGKLGATVGIISDITQRKDAEKALRDSEDRYRALVENLNEGIFVVKDGVIQFINRRSVEFTGRSAEELTSRSFLEFVHPDDREMVIQRHRDRMAGDDTPYQYTLRIVAPDGKVMWLLAQSRMIPWQGDIAALVSATDISARIRAEQALYERNEIQRALLSTIPAYVYLKGKDSVYLAGNRAVCESFGVTEDELPGKTDYDIFTKEEADRICRDDSEIMATGDARLNHEEKVTNQQGQVLWVSTSKAPFYNAAGEVAGLVGISIDVSEQRRAQELLLQAQRFRAVADLAGGVAHNFNNLLQIVIGNLELALLDLEMGHYTDIKHALEKVLESSRFGAETVRRLQSFAGLRERRGSGEMGSFDLSGIVRQAVDMSKTWWKTLPEKQGRKVSLDVQLQDGCLVWCEKNELFQVAINLIKNATEALTQDGAIDIQTRVEGDRVILEVRDTGVGISEHDLGRLFNPFFTTKANAGSGLGLASSRQIVEDCGGNIRVETSEGKGTTFTVVLPLAKGEPKPLKDVRAPAVGRRLTVLVIDDDEPIVDLMKNALTRHDCVVFTALSGEKGLDIFKENPVDLVICDLGMPGMTGWEVGKGIGAICRERGAPKTPFILLTGWGGQKTEKEKMAESGVDVVMEKPLNIKKLLEVIRQVAEKSQPRDPHK
ncbi:MAG: PAS domain S-box protein [Deltaproteobacteria bacterium]|nr:PAS domain S-box protein [Deltaproteobacteria bacterium]